MIYRSPHPPIEIPDVALHELVLGRAAQLGDKPAFIDCTSGRSLSFGEVDRLTRSLAAGLQARGLRPGQVVGVFAPNLPEYAVVFLGVARAGGVNSTINALYTAGEVENQLRASGARFLFTVAGMLDRALPAARAAGVEAVFTLDGAEGTPGLADALGPPEALVEPRLDPSTALVALPYSSGTTGFAKGVMLTHRNLVANLLQSACHLPLDADDVVAGVLPFFHIYGQTVVMNSALMSGATVVTMPRFELEGFLRMLERYRVTKAYVVPPIIVALAKHPLVDGFDASSLRMVMSGAAPLDAEMEQLCSRRIGVRVQQGYGLTEASPVTHCTPLHEPHVGGTIGKLLPNTEARLIDPATRRDAEPGQPGEVLVRGPQVMLGYLDDPQATANTLDSDGWLHTGDIATCEDGRWRIVDRLKELIKFKGYQVPPAMLEAVLLTHPAVGEACVVPVADEEAGEIPKAFVVAKRPVGADELMAYVGERVAPHERVRQLEFIDEVPKSPSGKLLRRVLVQRERNRAAAG